MVLLIALCVLVGFASAMPFNSELDENWKNYKLTFNKTYGNYEEKARRLIWEQNLARIVQHNIEANLGKHSYTMGLNHLSDMTAEEIKQTLNGYKGSNSVSHPVSIFIPPFNSKDPDEVDWRKEGLVTEVKNQGQCGSCWAFSATGSLEGQHKKKSGELVSLSEQNLLDCTRPEGNLGCDGGWVDKTFEYIRKNEGVDTEKSYPYEGLEGNCRFQKNNVGATVAGFIDVPTGDEDALKKAVATVGPISVAIDASQPSFHSYSDGVYDETHCDTSNLDHAVLVVGYGTYDGVDYWLVKNSWGLTWGKSGYIMMSRNKNNQCGIASEASYPLV